jgi:hypothetical protein
VYSHTFSWAPSCALIATYCMFTPFRGLSRHVSIESDVASLLQYFGGVQTCPCGVVMPLHMQCPRLQPQHLNPSNRTFIHASPIKRRWPKPPPSYASRSRHSSACGCKALADSSTQLLRPLLIDNYDSYTYNLYQIISEVYGGKALADMSAPHTKPGQ